MRWLAVAICAACSSPAPHHPLSNDTSIDLAQWHARRPLPASPNLADVVCLDPKGSIVLDVVPNPARATATVTPPDHIAVCAGGTCRTVVYAKNDDRYASAVTDGVHVALVTGPQVDVYRVSDGQHLYRLLNTTSANRRDAEEFSCGVADFVDDVILADGHDCEGPAAAPFLADVATGKTLAMLPFANDNGASSIELRALRVSGSRYALVGYEWSGCGTVSTGTLLVRTTRSATLPTSRCASPVRPFVPMMIRSTLVASANFAISSAGEPSRT